MAVAAAAVSFPMWPNCNNVHSSILVVLPTHRDILKHIHDITFKISIPADMARVMSINISWMRAYKLYRTIHKDMLHDL